MKAGTLFPLLLCVFLCPGEVVAPPAARVATGNAYVDRIVASLGANDDATLAGAKDAFLALEATTAGGEIVAGIEWFDGRADIAVRYLQVQPDAGLSGGGGGLGQLQVPEFTSRLSSISSSSLYYSDPSASSPDLPCTLVPLNGTEAGAHYLRLSMSWAPVRGLLFFDPASSLPSTSAFSVDTSMPLLLLAPELAPRCNLGAKQRGKVGLSPGQLKRAGRPASLEDAASTASLNGNCVVPGLGPTAKFDDFFAAKRAVLKDLDASIGESVHKETSPLADNSGEGGGGGGGGGGRVLQTEELQDKMASPASLRRALAAGHTHSTPDDFLPITNRLIPSSTSVPEEASSGRLLYISPSVSKGTRSILAVKCKFYGQPDTAVSSDSDLRTMMDTVVSELGRSSYGFATVTYSMPSTIIQLSSSIPVCTSSYDSITTDAKAKALSLLGVDPSQYRHFMMLLPNCQQQWGWAGLGSCPGGTVWLNYAQSSYTRTAVHELGHNFGLMHASFLDPVTGAWTEYLDPFEIMSSGGNDYNARDFNSGYKVDMGWLPADRILTFGSAAAAVGNVMPSGSSALATMTTAAADNAAPFTLLLASEDTGDLGRGGGFGNPLGLRFRAKASVLGFSGNRYIYATYRSRATTAVNGLVFNDVPHGSWTAGNARVVDTTTFTDSQNDADLEVGSAWTVDAEDGIYLVENRKLNAASDPRENTLSVRVAKLNAATSAPPYGLGCYGTTCQQSPQAPTTVTLLCVTNPTASIAVTVPVGETSYPRLIAVTVPDLSNRASTSPQQGLTAKLCNSNGATLGLAGFTDVPLAEVLTSSSLSRGNAPYPSSAGFISGSGWASGCRTVNFFVTSEGPRFIAASASGNPGDTATLTFSCAAPTGDAASAYGPAYSVGSQTSASLQFSNAYFSGAYQVSPTAPFVNGALQWVSASFRIVYSGGVWSLQPLSGGGYYAQQAGGTNLASLTSFGSMSFSFTYQCPAHSFAYAGSQGCTPCPLYSQSRGGGKLAVGSTDVSSVCFCKPGYFMSTGADGRSLCTPCSAGTFKERAGNSGLDATAGCISCPSPGYGSFAGSSSCTPVQQPPPSTGTLSGGASLCRSYLFTGFRSDVNGYYTLDSTVTVATTTSNNRDSWGEGKAVFASSTTAGRYMVVDSTSGSVYFGSDPALGSWSVSVKTFRAPQLWTTTEWTSTYATTARASCVCDPYTSATSYGGCVCPSGQAVDISTGRCKDTSSTGCSRNNGGCSDICNNSGSGPVCSCSRAGFGLDAATRSICSLCPENQFVGSGGTCTACPSNSPGRTSAGNSCGCPFGFVLTSSSSGAACVPPSDIVVDVAQTTIGDTDKTWSLAAAPFRGRFSACAPSVGGGVLAWQLVTPASGAAASNVPLYLVYHPSSLSSQATTFFNGSWSIVSGSVLSTPAAAPRYAFADAYSLSANSGWPSSVTAGGATMATATGAMVPSGTQRFFVFAPHPNGFVPGLVSFTPSSTGADFASLPSCGTSFDVVAADSAPKLGGTSTVTGGTSTGGGGTVVQPSTSATPSPAAPSTSPTGTATPSAAPSITSSASRAPSISASPSASLSSGASPSRSPSALASPSASGPSTPSSSPSSAVTTSPSPSNLPPSFSPSASPKPTVLAIRASLQFKVTLTVRPPRPLSSSAIDIKGISSSFCRTAASRVGDKARSTQGSVSAQAAFDCVRSRPIGKWPLGYDPLYVAVGAILPDAGTAALLPDHPPVSPSETPLPSLPLTLPLPNEKPAKPIRFLQSTATALPPDECDLGFAAADVTADPSTSCQLTAFDLVLALNDTVIVTDPALVADLSSLGQGSTVNAPLPPQIVQSQLAIVNAFVADPTPLLQAMTATSTNLDPQSNQYAADALAGSTISADATSVTITGGGSTNPVGVGAPVAPAQPPGTGTGGGGSGSAAGLSKSTIIAIVVGGLAALVALVVVITLAVVLTQRRKNKDRMASQPRTRRLSVPVPPPAAVAGMPAPLSSAPAAAPSAAHGAHARTASGLMASSSSSLSSPVGTPPPPPLSSSSAPATSAL